MSKIVCSLTATTPTASRPTHAIGEILGTAMKAAKDFNTDNLKELRANFFKFTWYIGDRLKELGFSQGQEVSELMRRTRAYKEKMMRQSEKLISRHIDLYRESKEAADFLDEIAALASKLEINPFRERSRYDKPNLEKVSIDGVPMTQAEAYDVLQEDLKKLKSMKNGNEAAAILRNLFASYQDYRKKLLDSIIQSYKDRAGEGDLKDDEVSASIAEDIARTKEQFRRVDNDAYITFFRDGKYVVNVYRKTKDAAGEEATVLTTSNSFKNRSEAEEFSNQQKQDPQNIVQFFKADDLDAYLYGQAGRGAVNSFFDKLKPELEKLKPVIPKDAPGYDEELKRIEDFKKKMHDLSLLLYPETSVKKQLVAKRKGTEGFTKDTLKVYAIMSDRYANQISRIQYGGRIDYQLADLSKAIKDVREKGSLSDDDSFKAVDYLNELTKRYYELNTVPTMADRVANQVNQMGFLWYMGYNVASTMVNLLQVAGVTMPYLDARFGFTNTVGELSRAYKDLAKVKGYISEGTLSERVDDLLTMDAGKLKKEYGLTKDEVAMLKELDDLGSLRSGMQIYDINDVANAGGRYPGSAAYALHQFNKGSGFMFQKAELINREVTALTAYRLARDKKVRGASSAMSREEAIKFADKAVEQSQGSYAADQAPRVFSGPVARTVLMFKKFPAHMATVYIQMFKEMFGKNVDPNTRRIAKRQFTGMMLMSGLMSGVSGMPFFYIIRDLLNLLLSDEDDPYNADLEFRLFLKNQLGDFAGQAMYRGLVGELGLDIGSRVSYESSFLLGGANVSPNVPFVGGILGLRDFKKGETSQDTMLNILGELAGPGFGIASSFARGFDQLQKGEPIRAAESMTPAFMRNVIKAARFADEGALTTRGDPIIDDLSVLEIVGQAFGFSPQRLSSQYKINNQIKDIEQDLTRRRNSLMDQYAKAYRANDYKTVRAVRKEIESFNRDNPDKGVKITDDGLRRSLKKREGVSEETDAGIFITKGIRPRLDKYKTAAEE